MRSVLKKIYRSIFPVVPKNKGVMVTATFPSRHELALKYIKKEDRGIEIAPWCHPIARKSEGYRVDVVDIFDTNTLRNKCQDIPALASCVDQIESVDIISSASDIGEAISKKGALGSYDYILSSHNFEHLPNPVKFLRACGDVLKKNGYVSLVVPDKRCTFDRYRQLTNTANFLEAYFEERSQPTPYHVYDFLATYMMGVHPTLGSISDSISFANDLPEVFAGLKQHLKDTAEYVDTHVSVFTAASFELIIQELIQLELIPLRLVEVQETSGFEFYVQLENVGYDNLDSYKIDHQRRKELYQKVFSC